MTTFIKIINKFRHEAWSERDKGFRFERLMQAYLKRQLYMKDALKKFGYG